MSSTDTPHSPAAKNITFSTRFGEFRLTRLIITLVLAFLAFAPGELGNITRAALEDAYIAVAVFVAATLFLFYGAEKLFGFDISDVFRRARYAQVPLASLLGALPGCGGAVVVVAAYSSGSISMGAVVAALTATMGDAAFLLIATRPDAAVVLLPIAFVVGIISGYIVDLFDKSQHENKGNDLGAVLITPSALRSSAYQLYLALAIPGFILGCMALAQYEFSESFAPIITYFSLFALFLGMIIWASSPVKTMTNSENSATIRTTEETAFITAWVVGAFLLFEYLVAFANVDLQAWFNTAGYLLPLIAVAIGFIPGCGPQILVTTFYINGLIPFSALIGNAIANDGDALFPAIALSPKAAIWATIYSAVPAIIVAYGFLFFLPDFL